MDRDIGRDISITTTKKYLYSCFYGVYNGKKDLHGCKLGVVT